MKKLKLSNGKYTQNKFTLLDDKDFEVAKKYKWFVDDNGYVATGKSHMKLHRFISNCPKDKHIDHINRDKLDNRRENLRFCSIAENNRNVGIKKNNTSGYKGVYLKRQKQGKYSYWSAKLRFNRKVVYERQFKTKEDAARAYNQVAKIYFGDFAFLNNIS